MNDPSGTLPSSPAPGTTDISGMPSNWRSAAADLIGSRLALIQLEIRQAAGSATKKAVLLVSAGFLLLSAWAVFVAGAIGLISALGNFPWYWVALSACGVHLLLAVILIAIAKRPGEATFSATRAEFLKDREWLEKFQSPNKSSN